MDQVQPVGIDPAHRLRRATTPAESILWKHLRGRRFDGFKFRVSIRSEGPPSPTREDAEERRLLASIAERIA